MSFDIRCYGNSADLVHAQVSSQEQILDSFSATINGSTPVGDTPMVIDPRILPAHVFEPGVAVEDNQSETPTSYTSQPGNTSSEYSPFHASVAHCGEY
jgi:hypothetical protein